MIHIIRGLPGAGKSTLAKTLSGTIVSLDNYHMVDGVYVFQPAQIPQYVAQMYCDMWTLHQIGQNIILDNTNTRYWEFRFAMKLCPEAIIHNLYDAGLTDTELHRRTVHGVPLSTIQKMRDRYEHA